MKCFGILFAKSAFKPIKKHYVCNVFLVSFRYVGKPSFPLGKQAFPDKAKAFVKGNPCIKGGSFIKGKAYIMGKGMLELKRFL